LRKNGGAEGNRTPDLYNAIVGVNIFILVD